jgi:hypothetical protein
LKESDEKDNIALPAAQRPVFAAMPSTPAISFFVNIAIFGSIRSRTDAI